MAIACEATDPFACLRLETEEVAYAYPLKSGVHEADYASRGFNSSPYSSSSQSEMETAESQSSSGKGSPVSSAQSPCSDESQGSLSSRGPVKCCKIFVGGMSPKTTWRDLHEHFSQFGRVKSCGVVIDNRGVSKRFGYCEFFSEEAAHRTVSRPAAPRAAGVASILTGEAEGSLTHVINSRRVSVRMYTARGV